jgi:predicted permease
MGRLKDGISIEQADAALQAVWPGVMASTTSPGMPDDRKARYQARRTALQPGRAGYSRVRNLFGEPLWLLMGLVTLLLAIACASIANLLLARGVARRKEIAVRLAIGAKRARVFRQLLTEALVLTLAGAAIGLLLASWAGGVLVAFMTTTREHLTLDTSPGWRMAGFTAALAIVVSTISALLPSLNLTRGDVMGGLRETGQPGAGLLRRWSAGKILVAVQVALALVLLSGAAVFGRSLARVLAQDAGVDSDRIVLVFPDTAAAGYRGPAVHGFYAQLLERLRALPGVESAALSWMPPISHSMGMWTESIAVDGSTPTTSDGGDARSVCFNGVSPRYFATVGMALRRGRDVSDADTASAPKVVIVNATFARRFFGAQDPLGHRISIGKDLSRQNVQIVGIVQDAKYRNLQEPVPSIAYLPAAQVGELLNGGDLVAELRVATTNAAVAAAARLASRTLDPRVPLRVETVADRIRESTLNERLIAVLAGALGVAALILACAGLYGLLAYSVSRHSREIGLRIALGARPGSVLWMVQRESLVLAGLGIAAGLGGALALGRFVRTMLFQITPADPIALGLASLVMLLVAVGAAYLPARRAASVDPVVALKRDC